MLKKVLISAVLVITSFLSQMEPVAARNVRRVAPSHANATQQLRDAFGSSFSDVQSSYSGLGQRHTLPTPPAGESRSCDIIWCYED